MQNKFMCVYSHTHIISLPLNTLWDSLSVFLYLYNKNIKCNAEYYHFIILIIYIYHFKFHWANTWCQHVQLCLTAELITALAYTISPLLVQSGGKKKHEASHSPSVYRSSPRAGREMFKRSDARSVNWTGMECETQDTQFSLHRAARTHTH